MAMSRTEPVSLDGIRAALRVAAEKFLRAVAKDHPSETLDRKSTRLNSSHSQSSYAVFCLKKKIVLTGADLWYFRNDAIESSWLAQRRGGAARSLRCRISRNGSTGPHPGAPPRHTGVARRL